MVCSDKTSKAKRSEHSEVIWNAVKQSYLAFVVISLTKSIQDASEVCSVRI